MPKPSTPAVQAFQGAQQGNADLDGGQFLTELYSNGMPRTAQLFKKVITFVNNLATSAANTGSGEITPPPPLAGLTVKAATDASEYVHVAINHPGAIQRGVQYFTEIGVNDPTFGQPIVLDHGASRTEEPFRLPTNDDNGNLINYYFRSYPQYHGSKRGGYAYYGSPDAPTAVNLAGTSNFTPLTSNGSGTASNSGTQGGQGLGNQLFRAAPAPKRQAGQ